MRDCWVRRGMAERAGHFLPPGVAAGAASGSEAPAGEGYRFRSALVICLAVLAFCSAGSHFEYAGLSPETDFGRLKQIYSTSTVQGGSVWLSKADSHDDVHYIEKRRVDGMQEVIIVFERPEDQLEREPASWEEGQYARHPKCETILQKLTQAYKQPTKERFWVEERLNHRVRTWSSPTESMDLDCYNIDGQGELLALELTIRSKTVVSLLPRGGRAKLAHSPCSSNRRLWDFYMLFGRGAQREERPPIPEVRMHRLRGLIPAHHLNAPAVRGC